MTEHTKLRQNESNDDRASPGTTLVEARGPDREIGSASLPNGSTAGYGFLFEANQQAFARWFHGITTLSGELAQFIQNRLQDDMAAWSALASCRTSEEAFDCQRRFAEKATAQYSEEITKLSQLMLKLASEGLGSFQRSAHIDA